MLASSRTGRGWLRANGEGEGESSVCLLSSRGLRTQEEKDGWNIAALRCLAPDTMPLSRWNARHKLPSGFLIRPAFVFVSDTLQFLRQGVISLFNFIQLCVYVCWAAWFQAAYKMNSRHTHLAAEVCACLTYSWGDGGRLGPAGGDPCAFVFLLDTSLVTSCWVCRIRYSLRSASNLFSSHGAGTVSIGERETHTQTHRERIPEVRSACKLVVQ